MKLLLVDIETTSLDINESRIIELGYAIWDTDRRCSLAIVNSYLWDETYPKITDEIKAITGISQEDIDQFHFDAKSELEAFVRFIEKQKPAYLVAHNARAYDIPVIENNLKRYGLALPKLPCIDTMEDLPFDSSVTCRKLGHLASDHGFINPFPHRAIFDALTMGIVLSKYPLDDILKRQSSPSVIVRALVSFEENHKAKALRFHWERVGEKFYPKAWVKRIKECDLESLKSKADFKIARLE